jgi:hypothetical protein
MITVVDGLHGCGKTWFIVHHFLYPEWKRGGNISILNTDLLFDTGDGRITKSYQLSDLYKLRDVLIGFPEIQKLINNINSLPPMFADLLSEHRHAKINIVGDTQDIMLISAEMRRHIAEVFHCRTVVRFPKDERKLPWIQWIRIQKKVRRFDTLDDKPRFINEGKEKSYFISRLWTKKLYDSHESLAATEYQSWIDRPRAKTWTWHLIGRELIASGRRKRR